MIFLSDDTHAMAVPIGLKMGSLPIRSMATVSRSRHRGWGSIAVACTHGRGLKSGVMELGQKMGSIKGGQGFLLGQGGGTRWGTEELWGRGLYGGGEGGAYNPVKDRRF